VLPVACRRHLDLAGNKHLDHLLEPTSTCRSAASVAIEPEASLFKWEQKMHKTLFLVADAKHAQLWSLLPKDQLDMIRSIDPNESHVFARDINSDRPGRAFSSAGSGRSAVQPRQDPMVLEHEHFAHCLADMVATEMEASGFDRLVLCASPKMLGLLRDCLPEAVAAKVIVEAPKNLIKLPVEELRDRLLELVH
jgi:protein required for attachment to host cells